MNTPSFSASLGRHSRPNILFTSALAALTILCQFAPGALAATTTWTGNSNILWSGSGNWTAGVPIAGSDAVIGLSGPAVVYDSATNPTLNSLTISATGGATLNQGGYGLTSVTEIIGDTSTGTFFQTSGTNTVTGTTGFQSLVLGKTTGGDGTYNISGGTLIANFISVGGGITGSGIGTGAFIQSGASSVKLDIVTTGLGQLYIGNAAGTTASYTMSGGTLDTQNEFVALTGSNGGGRSFVQTGGVNTIHYTGAGSGQLQIGGNIFGSALSSGTYTLSGPSSVLTAADEFIGVSGIGTFIQNDGVNNITLGVSGTNRVLYVGAANASGVGTYNLNNGTLNADYEYIGNPGTGSFTQAGGVNNVSQQLAIDQGGSYAMSGGTLNASGTDTTYRAIENNGSFNLTGGNLNANGSGLRNTGTFAMSAGGALNGSGTKLNDVGGTFNVNGGTLAGSGTFVNLGTTTITGSNLIVTIASPVQNGILVTNTTNYMYLQNVTAVFFKTFTNYANVKNTNSTITFRGPSSNGGIISGDPTFEADHSEIGNGAIVAGSGEFYRMGNGFFVTSTNNTGWDTTLGTLQFFNKDLSSENANPTGKHQLQYDSGVNYGQSYLGYINNFSWQQVIVDPGNSLDTIGTGFLYTYQLALGTSGTEVSLINSFTGGMTIYYDPTKSSNDYLAGGTYNFGSGGGKVAPVPEPSSLALMGICTLIGAGVIIRRKVRQY